MSESQQEENVELVFEPIIDSFSPPIKADIVFIKQVGETVRLVGTSEDAMHTTAGTPTYTNAEGRRVVKIRPVIVMDLDRSTLFGMILTLAEMAVKNPTLFNIKTLPEGLRTQFESNLEAILKNVKV
jgi:hypothetical protein